MDGKLSLLKLCLILYKKHNEVFLSEILWESDSCQNIRVVKYSHYDLSFFFFYIFAVYRGSELNQSNPFWKEKERILLQRGLTRGSDDIKI